MNLDNQLLFFFSALGAFNSVILSIYFLAFAKPKHRSNFFLGGLLAVLSIRIWKSLFFYFNPELSKIYLQIGLSACFFIGPFLYFYIKSKTSTEKQSTSKWGYLLSFLLVVVIAVGYLYPYDNNYNLWRIFYKIINYQWLLFIVLSGFLMGSTLKKLISKSKSLSYDDVWVLSTFFGVFIIWLAYFTASYTSYILGALSFTFALYLSILLLIYKRKQRFVVLEKKEKYSDSKIADDEAEDLLKRTEQLLNEQELFKNPNLTLGQLAKQLNIRSHTLSQLLNDNLNKSFSTYINAFRIEEAKKLLKSDRNLKMEIIAEKSGFNSNSTFYAAFKKMTNTTPAKFIKDQNL